MADRSRLVRMRITNLGCIGIEGLTVELNDIVCVVGANNSGKSTILRAYELALATVSFDPDRDLCKRAGECPATVELWVHIPVGTMNIAEKWKEKDGANLVVRSRWTWSKQNFWKPLRETWIPEAKTYSTEDQASGLDTVFKSRLPKPFRVGTLDAPDQEHTNLVTLAIQPLIGHLSEALLNPESLASKALAEFHIHIQAPITEKKAEIHSLKADLNKSHNAIFPGMEIDIEIGLGKLDIDASKLLAKNSFVKFKDNGDEINWKQQGTGSQRALFWTMLQVRSKLEALQSKKELAARQIQELEKKLSKLTSARKPKAEEIGKLQKELDALKARQIDTGIEQESAQSLPGHMLLIDEPEVGLHPNAVRAACSHLYELADGSTWQVMMTTHSPQFIDPLRDHTTIVRLDRKITQPSPKTFRSDSVNFNGTERENLKLLNRFDTGLAEMFFGAYPVLVEGDTEFASFQELMSKDPQGFPDHSRPAIIRARGKATLVLLIRILEQFKVNFSVLHDSDFPKRRDGKGNSAWTSNKDIFDAILAARKSGCQVVHRVSIPSFELWHLGKLGVGFLEPEVSIKDKPWNMIALLRTETVIQESILGALRDLAEGKQDVQKDLESYIADLTTKLTEWIRTSDFGHDLI